MSAVDVLAVLDEWIASNNVNRPGHEQKVRMDTQLDEARAAVAELIEAARHAELTFKPWGSPKPTGERDAVLARLREAIRGVGVGCVLCGKNHSAEIVRGYAPHGESGE